MALSTQSSFPLQPNLVIPLAPAAPVPLNAAGLAVRVASQGAGTLGSITAVGAAGTVSWSLNNSPSWITLVEVGTVATLSFGAAVYQPNPYEFYVSLTDGVTIVNFPILLEVKSPLSLTAVLPNASVSGTTFTIPSYSDDVADIVIYGVGVAGLSPVSDVSFILPSAGLPAGLNWITSNETKLALRVADPSLSDLSGGLKLYTTSPESISLPIAVYQPGSMYDAPDLAFLQTFTLQSLVSTAGTLDYLLGVSWNTSTSRIQFDAHSHIEYIQGLAKTGLKYIWNTPAGLVLEAGGSITSQFAYYAPSGAIENPTVTLQVQDSIGNTLSTTSIGPVPISNDTSWLGTAAIKLGTSAATTAGSQLPDFVQAYAGDTVTVTVSSVDSFNSDETLYLSFTIVSGSGLESLVTPSTTTAQINAGTPTTEVSLGIPATALPGEKWALQIKAANASSSPSRTGFAQVVVYSNGGSPIELTLDGHTALPSTISSNTGSLITPLPLIAVNNNPNSTTYGSPLSGVTFELVGAPDGLFIQNNAGNYQITGNALQAGTYTFKVCASATGFARSYSSSITLNVTQVQIPLTISNVSSNQVAVANGTAFNVSWGTSGNASTLSLEQSPSATPIYNVLNSGSISLAQTGTSVYSLFGTSFYGTSYGIPIIVVSSSVSVGGQLLPAPTIAVITQDYELTVNWQPYSFDGGYSIYKGWNIVTTPYPSPPGTPTISFKTANPLATGETVDSRSFSENLGAGDFLLNMQAISNNQTQASNSNTWDSSHLFPSTLTAASVTLSATSLLLGQPFTVTLNPDYSGADYWQVLWPDNTSTGYLPLASAVAPKIFNTIGTQNIIIQTEYDYSENNPPVKLSRQLTVTVFVANQQYIPPTGSSPLEGGAIALGGQQQFEITNDSVGGVSLQPYEVVVRSIARDTQSNELKLLVATSRFSNSSSILGTAAFDVIPIQGRPQAKELLDPDYILQTTSASSVVPASIQTTSLPPVIVGKPMTEFQLQATGGTPPYIWATDGLPLGIRLSSSGTLSGTPLQLGYFSSNFSVQDSSSPFYIDEVALQFLVQTDLVITTTSLPNATVGTPYQVQMLNTGGLAPYTWDIAAGALPIGLSINAGTGLLSGVPCTYNSTTDFSTTFSATIQITDAVGALVSAPYSMSLLPAVLQFGSSVDQPVIFCTEQFKLAIPVFGGQSPYTLTSFKDDGVIGSGLEVINPVEIEVVAGLAPPTLAITTGNQEIFVAYYPINVMVSLVATGGVPSNAGLPAGTDYKFFVNTTSSTTLPNAQIYGNILTGVPTSDGLYTVAITCIDSAGHTANATINLTIQQQTPPNYAATFSVLPSVINFNSSTSASNWTITPLSSGFPNVAYGGAFRPAAGQTYALVLYRNTSPNPTPVLTMSPPIQFICPYTTDSYGLLPPGVVAVSGNTVSGTGADGIIFLQGTVQNNSTAIGSYSFVAEFSNITSPTSTLVTAATRSSITVTTPPAAGTTTVVVVTSLNQIDIDLNTVVASSILSQYSWVYPLAAEGGTAPYSFQIQTGSTLPGLALITVNGLPAFTSLTTDTGTYSVIVSATDSLGNTSSSVTIPVQIGQSSTQPIYILDNNLPSTLYVNRAIAVNTYYVDSDLVANWTAVGLPQGVILSSALSNRVYLEGTPNTSGTYSFTLTATSVSFGTSASQTFSLQILAQSAQIIAPTLPPHTIPATAVVGTQYRVINNNSILAVQYVGYQPLDSNLPILYNTLSGATVGSPGLLIGGQPSTGNSSISSSGFTMNYDYIPTTVGQDTISLQVASGPVLDSLIISDVYPTLVVIPTSVSQTISEYATTATFNLPISASGGNGTYTYNVATGGTSDSRFTVINNNTSQTQLQIQVNQFAVGQTVTCQVSVTVSDTESVPQTASTTGTLQVTIHPETYITVNFQPYTWNISKSQSVQVGYVIPNQLMSIPELYHPPATYAVTLVSLPLGLGSFIQVSPSNRVLAYNLTESNSQVSDVDSSLSAVGLFTVTPETITNGTYVIGVTLQVTDAQGISLTSTQSLTVVIGN
jgi:Putative Ig domain